LERLDLGWLPESHVSFEHPFRPNDRFVLFHCAAHILKALRNALFSSRPAGVRQGPRILRNENVNVPITWAWIESLFHWDQATHNGQRTKLVFEAVYLSGFGSMNMAYAKSICSQEVIAELMLCAFTILQIDLPVPPDPFLDITDPILFRRTTRQSNGNKQSLLIAGQKWAQCDKLENAGAWPANNGVDPRPTIRYLVFLTEIFTETLLNAEEYFTAENIASVIVWVRHRMKFMENWKTAVEHRRSNPPINQHVLPDINTQFLAPETWMNMRACVTGFLTFASTMTAMIPNARIPALISTSSSLECVFAQLRARANGNLSCTNTSTALSTIDTKGAEKYLQKKNASYDAAGLNDDDGKQSQQYRTKKASDKYWLKKHEFFAPFAEEFASKPHIANPRPDRIW
jgi:hypothetical protein